jgi:hypothetical protein
VDESLDAGVVEEPVNKIGVVVNLTAVTVGDGGLNELSTASRLHGP